MANPTRTFYKPFYRNHNLNFLVRTVMNNAEKLARPILKASKEQGNVISHEYEGGLTKRERFAMAAMQGILATQLGNDWLSKGKYQAIAYHSSKIADAQLNKLEETQ